MANKDFHSNEYIGFFDVNCDGARSVVVTRVFSATSIRQVDRSDKFDSHVTPQVAMCGSMAEWLGRWTCDQYGLRVRILASPLSSATLGKLLTRMCLCHQAV